MGIDTLSVREPDGTWRVIGEVDSLEVKQEIERRLLLHGEVFVDSQGRFREPGEFEGTPESVTVDSNGFSTANWLLAGDRVLHSFVQQPSRGKRSIAAWKTRHYGPSPTR